MKKFTSVLLSIIFILSLFAVPFSAYSYVNYTDEKFADKETVYVASNPKAYPLEYYDKETKKIEGAMPKLLEYISEKTGYNFTYIDSTSGDNRKELARNNQVEMLTCVLSDEESIIELTKKQIKIFPIKIDGKDYEVYIAFTGIASDELISAVESCVNSVSNDEINAIALGEILAEEHASSVNKTKIIVALILNAVLFVAIVIFVIFNIINKKRLKRTSFIDQTFEVGNKKYLKKVFDEIEPNIKSSYYLHFFAFDITNVNKYYNNTEVDEILSFICEILKKKIEKNDVLARVNGGGFAVLRLTTGHDAVKWSEDIVDELGSFKTKFSKIVNPKFNCGLYKLNPADDMQTALNFALQGYLEAQKTDLPCYKVSEDMINKYIRDNQFQRDVGAAVSGEEFELFLQPIVAAKTQETLGFEALSRWNHKQYGFLNPGEYIDILEKTGEITRLDFYIFEKSCELLCTDYFSGNDMSIFCNFSRTTVSKADFFDRLSAILENYGFNRAKLVIEVTESIIHDDKKTFINNLHKVKSLGIRLALDDMGDGYTSFSDLRDYPVDIVKIDKSILDDIDQTNGIEILEGIIALSHILSKTVLCEGIEKEQQIKLLQDFDCDLLQGFYFSKPMPIDVILK